MMCIGNKTYFVYKLKIARTLHKSPFFKVLSEDDSSEI